MDEEPYLWLLRGLQDGVDESLNPELATAMSERVAGFIDSEPDVNRPEGGSEQILYNALQLSACLAAPTILAEPLHRMYVRRELEGAYYGTPLYSALRAALIYNQTDDRLKEVWFRFLIQDSPDDPDEVLTGDPYVGYEGIVNMPTSTEEEYIDNVTLALQYLIPFIQTIQTGPEERGQGEQNIRFIQRAIENIKGPETRVAVVEKLREIADHPDAILRLPQGF